MPRCIDSVAQFACLALHARHGAALAVWCGVLAMQSAVGEPLTDGKQQLAVAAAKLIADAIPREYERRKDWGATKHMTVGLTTEGGGLNLRVKRRQKEVNDGVWKHYRLSLEDPSKDLKVQMTHLAAGAPGRMDFALSVEMRLKAWGRAKVYERGIHLGSFETEADAEVRLAISGDLGLQLRGCENGITVAIDPRVRNSRLQFDDLKLRRVSNAHGPMVRLLGEGLELLLEEELSGKRLTAKLSRAIDKKRDRLAFTPAELAASPWQMLQQWAEREGN